MMIDIKYLWRVRLEALLTPIGRFWCPIGGIEGSLQVLCIDECL
jgi:hypothetical protein